MPQDDAGAAHAERARGLDELALAQAEHVAAHDARGAGPLCQAEHDDDDGDRRLEQRDDQDEQDEARERQHHVGEAHQRGIDLASDVAGDRADERAQRDAHRGRDEADRERDARAMDDAAHDVAAEQVGAERVRGARRQVAPRGDVLRDRVVRRDERGEQRDQVEQRDDPQAGERQAVPAKVPARDAPLRVAAQLGRAPARGEQVPERARPEKQQHARERGERDEVVERAAGRGEHARAGPPEQCEQREPGHQDGDAPRACARQQVPRAGQQHGERDGRGGGRGWQRSRRGPAVQRGIRSRHWHRRGRLGVRHVGPRVARWRHAVSHSGCMGRPRRRARRQSDCRRPR